jgi:2',3'-cyclic-nucleotide 2'-phosphodiesterase (5'-nucleotidase family)
MHLKLPLMANLMFKKRLVYISILFFISCAKVNHVADVQVSSYKMDDAARTGQSEAIDSLINPYKMKIDTEMNVVIGLCAKRLNMAVPESTLGNLIADVLYQKAVEYYEGQVDFAVINYSSIRLNELQKGDITRGLIYELMPFENHLVIVKVDKNVVYKLFENIAKSKGWPVSKQVKFVISESKPIDILIDGKPLKEDYIYHIAVPDYLANGNSGCSFFKGEDRADVDVLIREMIMEGILDFKNKGEPINADLEGRISLKK